MIEFMTKEDRKKLYSLVSKHKVREDDNKITLDYKLIIKKWVIAVTFVVFLGNG